MWASANSPLRPTLNQKKVHNLPNAWTNVMDGVHCVRICVFLFCYLSKLFEFCLLYPSVLSIVQSPCVLVSAVSCLIDCFIPQVFSIVCHYLPVSVLFIPQCFSFWLLVRLIPFCGILCLLCLLSVWHSVSWFFWPRLHCYLTLIFGFSLWYFCSVGLLFGFHLCLCLGSLFACLIKHLPLERHPESARGSSVPDSDTLLIFVGPYLQFALWRL